MFWEVQADAAKFFGNYNATTWADIGFLSVKTIDNRKNGTFTDICFSNRKIVAWVLSWWLAFFVAFHVYLNVTKHNPLMLEPCLLKHFLNSQLQGFSASPIKKLYLKFKIDTSIAEFFWLYDCRIVEIADSFCNNQCRIFKILGFSQIKCMT